MQPSRTIGSLGISLLICSLAAGACSDTGDTSAGNSLNPQGGAGNADSGSDSGSDSSGGGGTTFFDATPGEIVALKIDPAAATLTSVDESKPTQSFVISAVMQGGATQEVTSKADFVLEPLAVGDVDINTGVFTANGLVGGAAKLTVSLPTHPNLKASADITVNLERTLIVGGAPTDAATKFTALVSDPTRAADLVYPLDGAVMPQNVFPANLQWMRSADGDIFRITASKPHMQLTAYVQHTGTFDKSWLVQEAAWQALAQTDPDDQAEFKIDRYDTAAGDAVEAATSRKVTFARAAITGSVYYWDIQAGLIQRINDGSGTAETFMPTPPSGTDGNNCVGCHSVSPSGRWMAGRLGGGENIGAVFDLTKDLTSAPAPTEYPLSVTPPSLRWWDSSWNPAEDRIVVAYEASNATTRQLRFYDPFGGAEVPVTGSLPAGLQPSWSPDGARIAYIANPDSWGGQLTAGDIAILDVAGPDSVGSFNVIHTGASLSSSPEGGATDSYPTWAPDSNLIAFAHGTGSRSDLPDGKQSALYAMVKDGSGVVRLDTLNGSSTDNFQPNFSPFDEGGYYWLTFLSRRDYGNDTAGTRGTQRQQIWIAAIKKGVAAGTDPSAVPYWIPGQNTASKNISAFYAPRPCREDGEECSVDSECCGGDCRPDSTGKLVCSPPPPEKCRQLNDTCTTSADCCDEHPCINNVCVEQVQ